jgi:hypothetical protein
MPSVTISSAGTSDSLILDYIGAKTTSVRGRFSSSTSSAAFTVQATLNSSARGETITWFTLSSATFTSSTNFDNAPLMQILTPLAGVRLNSTGLSSGSISLSVLQNSGG